MQVNRALFSLLSFLAFSAAAQATVTDHYTFLVDSTQSQVQYEIDTNLGQCTLGTGANGNISGNMIIVLHPGMYPVSDGQFDGGDCGCQPDLVGIIPGLPGLPPTLEVHLDQLVVRPHSAPFQCDNTGLFLTDTSVDVVGGNLDVSLMGAPFVPVPILGLTSDSTRSHGQVWIDGTGIHLVREIGNVIDIGVPSLGLDLQVAIRGVIRGDMGYPVPTPFCPATPNSSGQPGRIDFGGTPSVSRDDGQLLVMNCPPNTNGLFIAGDQQGQVPFGNGTRCATGQLLRLGAIHLGSNGAGSAALQLRVPPCAGNVVAGSQWNFQFLFRDVAAGGAMTDTTDAIAVDFVP